MLPRKRAKLALALALTLVLVTSPPAKGLDEHAVLLCGSVQDVFEPRLYVTHKDFATVLRAEHDVVRQVEDGSCVLDVTAILWLLNFHIIHLPKVDSPSGSVLSEC
jgi:hypothetical protein